MISKSRLWFFIFFLISGAIILFPLLTHALTFQYAKPITIDHTKVPADLINFPALISITNDNDLKNHVTSPSGYDLVFTDALGNPLDHEIESWDGATGAIMAWVRIPSLSSTADTVIYAWYGNSEVTSSLENKAGVWDSNYKGVWHLKEATGASIADSTSNGNTGTPQNSPTQAAGIIGGSLNFNGTTQYATTPITAVYQQFTLSAWIKPSSTGTLRPNIIGKTSFYATSYTDWPVSFYIASNGTSGQVQISPGVDYSTSLLATTPGFTANQWHQVVATYDGTTLRAYADGAYNQVTGSYTLPSNSRSWTIGRAAYEAGGGVGGSIYKGSMDEVRISNVARSPEWVLAEYNNQSSPSTFHSVGSEGGGGFINHAPVAQNQSVTTSQDTAKPVTLVATDIDGDPLNYQIVDQPTHGTLSGTAPNVTYTPAPGYSGSDSFTFKAYDVTVDSNVATVSITIYPVINCGQPLTGSISTAGQRNSYNFTASANDGITIRARKTSGSLTPYIELYGPSGSLITGAANQVDRILTETGTYRIDVRDQNNTNTGNYILFWQRMNNPSNPTPIDCGQGLTGSVGTSVDPPPWKVYTFTGAVNDVVTIRTGNISGGSFIPTIELYSPTGSLLTSAYNQVNRTLTVAGTYAILMRDYSNAYSGTFSLTWQKMNNPCNAVPINCGQVLAGSISAAGEMDVYTITASANDVITIRLMKTSGTFLNNSPNMELYNSAGTLITGPTTSITITLTAAGTYRILVKDGNLVATGSYIIYLQTLKNPCNVAANLECGQIVSGSIGSSVDPPPWRIYTFTGAVGDVVTIRAVTVPGSGSLYPLIELYNPNGAYITNAWSQVNATLTVAGAYTILIRDYNGYAGNFVVTWQKTNNPCNATPITCGQVLESSISAVGELDPYTFTALANDVVTIRVKKTSGTLNQVMELYNPAGALIAGPTTTITMTLTGAGTYKILVKDYNTAATGNYLLYLQTVKNPCNVVANLDCGQIVSGSLGTSVDPPPWRVYTFTGAVNDVVTIRAVGTGGSVYPLMELYSPTGAYLQVSWSPLNRTLTAAGTYTILVYDNNGYAGNFVLTWQKMNEPCNATPINCGQVLGGSISTAGELDVYTFSASANDVVTIRMRKTSGTFTPVMDFYNPAGTLISAQVTQIDMTLTAAGTYKILMRDSSTLNTGGYVLYAEKLNNPCNPIPISCSQPLAGSIGTSVDPPPWRVYTFEAAANDIVTIQAANPTGSFRSQIDLYNPSGAYIAGAYNRLDRTLTVTGTYKILLRDYYNTYAGNYVLTWQKFNAPCAPAINCGQTAAGVIGLSQDAPPWGFYSFTVVANDIMTIRAIKTSGTLVPFLELYNSSGGLVTSAAGQINRTMTAGSYVLLLKDQSNTYTGGYAVTWQRWNNPCATAANCGQVMTGSIGLTADPPPWRYYSLIASANDSMTIRASKTSGTLTPYLEIYNPSGTQVASGAGQKDVTLAASGTYTIVVRDQNSINTGDYVFTWLRLNNPCNATPLGCGQVFPSSLSMVGKIDVYTISANSGDNIVLTLTKTSGGLDPSLELYNSSGTRVAYQYTASGNQAVITQTLSTGGTYTVFASDYGNDETGTYTLKFQKNNNSCTDVSLLAPIGGENIPARSILTVRWSCASPPGITSQEIRLSTDGGINFPTLIATGLAGDLRTYNWNVPSDLSTNQARIRVTVTDGSAVSVFDDSDSDFMIYQGVGRTYVYDELNRLIQIIYEDGRRVTYSYDASGNRITVTNEP